MESYLVWYISAGLLLITEAFTPGLFLFICFALAAFITGFIDQVSNLNTEWLLGIALILSTLLLFTLKPLLAKIIRLPQVDEGLYGDYARSLVGQEAMVFKEITREPGLVKLYDYDETWLAKSADGSEIGIGACVIVKEVTGNSLVVQDKAES